MRDLYVKINNIIKKIDFNKLWSGFHCFNLLYIMMN